MTVAALQAQALGQCLTGGTTQLARRFFRAAAEPIEVTEQFTRVIVLLDPSSRLMRPKMLVHAARRRRSPVIPQETEVLTSS